MILSPPLLHVLLVHFYFLFFYIFAILSFSDHKTVLNVVLLIFLSLISTSHTSLYIFIYNFILAILSNMSNSLLSSVDHRYHRRLQQQYHFDIISAWYIIGFGSLIYLPIVISMVLLFLF